MTTCKFRIHRLLLYLAFATQAPTLVIKTTNSPICDSKTTLEGLDHQHLWWLEKAATSTTLDLEILQGITPVEDMRELFGYKTLDTKKAHYKHKISQLQKIKQLKRNMVCKYKFVLMYNEYNLYFDSFTKEYPMILSSLNLTRTRIFLTLIGRWIDRFSQ